MIEIKVANSFSEMMLLLPVCQSTIYPNNQIINPPKKMKKIKAPLRITGKYHISGWISNNLKAVQLPGPSIILVLIYYVLTN